MASLEERLSVLDDGILPTLKSDILSQPTINPREHREDMPRLKDQDLVPCIIAFFKASHLDFDLTAENIYSSLNKNPLKRIYYGMLTEDRERKMTNVHMPLELLDCLTDWEKMYFLAGRFCKGPNSLTVSNKRFDDVLINLDTKEELYLFVAEYLVAGMNLLKMIHRQTFDYELKLPYENDILEYCQAIKREYIPRLKIDTQGNAKTKPRIPEQLYFSDAWRPSAINPKTGKRRR